MYVLSVISFSEATRHPEAGSVFAEQTARAFETGALFMTEGVRALVEKGLLNPASYLDRHCGCDWGDLCEEDLETNQHALRRGYRLFSSYETGVGDDRRLWIITEGDRSMTTLLLPSEY